FGDPQNGPDERGLALCSRPRMVVVRTRNEIEADFPGTDRLPNRSIRAKFFGRDGVADVGRRPTPRRCVNIRGKFDGSWLNPIADMCRVLFEPRKSVACGRQRSVVVFAEIRPEVARDGDESVCVGGRNVAVECFHTLYVFGKRGERRPRLGVWMVVEIRR